MDANKDMDAVTSKEHDSGSSQGLFDDVTIANLGEDITVVVGSVRRILSRDKGESFGQCEANNSGNEESEDERGWSYGMRKKSRAQKKMKT